ncbi:MAG: hypothetical protein WKF84_12335 [Pyrinomonadaceae bacterium]
MPTAPTQNGTATTSVLLTGGHRVGQILQRPSRDGLDRDVAANQCTLRMKGSATRFLFRPSSPALLPLSPLAANIRLLLISSVRTARCLAPGAADRS